MQQTQPIVFVDDDPAMGPLVAATLRPAGLNVLMCATAQEAMDALQQESACLLITDLDMPGLDGKALTKHVVTTHPDVPVLILTGHGSEREAVQCFRAGAADYVTKEDLRGELLDVVTRLIMDCKETTNQLFHRPATTEEVSPTAEKASAPAKQVKEGEDGIVLKWGNSLKKANAELGEETRFTPEKLDILRRQAERLEKWSKFDAAASARKHERQYYGHPAYILPMDEAGNPDSSRRFVTFCRNLSAGGCSLLHSRLFRQKEFVIFFSYLMGENRTPAAIHGRIARDRPLPMGMYEIGVQFLKLAVLPKEDIDFLRSAIEA